MTVEITDANFEEVVMKADKPVLIDFWAEWCGPCRTIGPFISELAGEYEGKVVVGKLNVDQCPQTAAKFGIRSIPTVLLIKNGEIVDKHLGAAPKSAFSKMIDNNL